MYIDKLRREFRSLISVNHCLHLAMAEWKHIKSRKACVAHCNIIMIRTGHAVQHLMKILAVWLIPSCSFRGVMKREHHTGKGSVGSNHADTG